MRTYRELFRQPQFTPLFATAVVHSAAQTMGGLALATLVYRATESPLLSALSMFGTAFTQVIGATFLMSAADRLPPRAAMSGIALVFALGAAVLALPGLPVWGVFVVLLGQGVVGSVGGGVRYGLLTDVLPPDGFVLGRSVLNMANGTMQVCGFAVSGLLVVVLSPRATLVLCAALFALAAGVARFGLRRRAPRVAGRPSVRETWRVNAVLWSSVPRRYVFLAGWVPNGLVVGCEALFVSYEPENAGLLFSAAAAGMLAGDTVLGRFVPPALRERLAAPLRLLLAAPYLVFFLSPPLPVAMLAALCASVGFAASLLLQERLMALTPRELSGQAMGLQTAGMLTMQGVGAALAGGVAQLLSPAAAMSVMAAASVAVTLALAPGLRPLPKADGVKRETDDAKPETDEIAAGYGSDVSDSSDARVAGP
ncbi:MFS transporter [Streptomyces sp. NPDC051940]|uniref:MFS transporter n=1 Tax=Streptomyces sp. NPDC051940 TaxID=3155675 RepID=UPI0034204A5A